MGRREQPLDPASGPIARFAYELRKLRQEAGGLTYRAMAARAHYSAATLAQAAAGYRLPSLPVALAYVRACGGDVETWRRRWEEADREALAQAAAEDDSPAPYLGLARFETSDQDRFFGRGALVERLAALVGEHRLVLLVGPSGSGKSSLLRAGLVPRLLRTGDTGGRPPMVRVVTPGPEPRPEEAGVRADVLVVDQFEEVFALCADPARRAAFIDALLAAARAEKGPRVVLAVRADFFGQCAGHRGLAESARDATLLMSPMSAAELRAAIVRPAAGAGLVVERELTTMIVGEVEGEPGALPLMSHALLETWRRRRGRVLTVASYTAAGGLRSAIARTSEELYAGLSPARRERLRHLMLRLVTPGQDGQDTRRPVERAELLTGEPDDETGELLERLARARLVTLDEGRVDLAHEALLTAWPRLRGWIEEDRERLRVHRRLTEAAGAWQDHDRDPGGLYRGVALAVADEHLGRAGVLTPLERDFLTASRAARDGERRRRRRRATATAVLLVLTLTAALLAWQQSRTGEQRQREAEARRTAGVAASLRDSDPRASMRLALAAWRLADLPETRSALLAAAVQPAQDVFTDPAGGSLTRRHLSADGRTLLSVGADQVTSWDLDARRATGSMPAPGAALDQLGARRGDAWTLPMRLADGEVGLWDLRTGSRAPAALGRAPDGFEAGPDGRTVIGYDAGRDTYRVRVWDTRTRRELLTVEFPRRAPADPAEIAWEFGTAYLRSSADRRDWADPSFPDATLGPDGRLLALCVPGEPLQLWDVAAARRIGTPWAPVLTREQCQYERVRFTPDGGRLAVVTTEKVRMWELASGKELPGVVRRDVKEVSFSADGAFLAASDGAAIVLWRLASPELPVFRHPLSGEQAVDLRVDPGANRIRYLAGSGSTWPATVRTLDLGGAASPGWREEAASAAAFGPDGAALALGYPGHETGLVRFRLYDRRTGRPTADLPEVACPEPKSQIPQCTLLLAFDDDGRRLAYGGSPLGYRSLPTRVSVWDVARARLSDSLTLDGGARSVGALAFGPGGTLLAASPPLVGRLSVWDPRSRTVTKTLPDVTGHELRTDPDRRLLVTSMGDLVDLPSTRRIQGRYGPGQTTSLAFSPDGRYLAAGDATGRTVLWDGRAERRLGTLAIPTTAAADRSVMVNALAFSPDGTVLATGGANGSLQLWDVASRQPIGSPLPTPGDAVLALAFGDGGRVLYAAGEHVPVQRYELDPAASAAVLCRRAGELTSAEWRSHFPQRPYQRGCPPVRPEAAGRGKESSPWTSNVPAPPSPPPTASSRPR
ncbi:helix-turn-helix domain-containing protein [Nonomuraea sp. NPDC003560]|uniref:nSTAND1 domain-containing NTPase n=1 Tax=Nonomuraea sp. NPDC003560 TaxID=3364341 RepID=UPI0036C5B1AB